EARAEIRGRDLVSGLPRVVSVTTEDIREGLEESVTAICDAVRGTLDHTPPELAADIMESGITLAGGGALLRNLDQRMANETGMPITVAQDPLLAVVRGCGHVLDNLDQR
ncbi:MAG: rod shape-determining protein, partial [Acidimicrobiaceae bacterium]|nr:rod shape-determining protein [Acidimicrobiaceae bacterium]